MSNINKESFMSIHNFFIRLDEQEEMSGPLVDDIYNSKCDDSIIFSFYGKIYVEFDREGRIYEEALSSALEDLGKIPYLFNKMSVVPNPFIEAKQN